MAVKLVGIAGSLRKASYNAGLLRAAKGLLTDGNDLDVHSLHGIPLYDGDSEEADGVPEPVTKLKEAIAAADGLVIATPEYNNSIPGVLKNGIDWLTRPPADIQRVFRGKPVAVIGASAGGFGTILSQNDCLPILRYLGTRPWYEGRLLVSHAGKLFDTNGDLTDEATREQLQKFIQGFAVFASQCR